MIHHRLSIALLSLLPAACLGPSVDSAREALARLGTRTQLVMLGTGTPNADPNRSGPSLAIIVDNTAYIVDCGPGVVRRAAAAARKGHRALQPRNLHHVFLTHLHSDHTLGLPDLIFTPWVLDRDRPLSIHGPPGTQAMTDHLQEAWQEDKAIRLEGLEPANAHGHETEVHEVTAGLIYTDDLVKVFAFEVPHGTWPVAFGFRFETPDRVIVISGDTAPSEELVRNAKDCDILVHEVYSAEAFKFLPTVWQRYHASFHTSTLELAAIATRIEPTLLVLTHQLLWGNSEEEMLSEFEGVYEGAVVSSHDLDVY